VTAVDQSRRQVAIRHTALSLGVLALYTAVSCAVFGQALLPHPGRAIMGLRLVGDPEAFIWELGWWAHAVQNGINPFVTNVVYYPVGANLIWTPTGPGLGLVSVPLTLLVGPIVAYNAVMVLVPAGSAWTAYLLCRYLTRSLWASLVGGFLFGFSSYVTSHMWAGNPNLAPVLLPVTALVVLRYLRRDAGWRGLALQLGAILALELTVSTELTLTLTLALAVGLLIGFAVSPGHRQRIVSSLAPIAGAYLVAAILAAPFVYYLLSDYQSSNIARGGDGDVLNIFLPTRLIAVGGAAFAHVTSRFTDTVIDADMYLGLPTLLILGLYVWRGRRTEGARFIALAVALAWVLSLGPNIRFQGDRIAPGPWDLALHVSLLANIIETRLTVYATLAASVAVALWTASTRGRWSARPVVLPVLAVAAIAPAAWTVSFVGHAVQPAFFTQSLYKLCIPKGEVLAIFPYGRFGDSMIYQAESGFWFKIAEGNLGRDRYPAKFVFADRTVEALQFFSYDPANSPTMPALKAWARRFHVDRMVAVQGASPAWPSLDQMHAFGQLQVLGNAGVAPACGYDSLAGDKRRIPGQ
jgi:hypothetical protein